MIVYLNGATSRKKMPTVGWLRKCYQQIDRRWVLFFLFSKYAELKNSSVIIICNEVTYDMIVMTASLALSVQVAEELKVFDNRPSFLVYSHAAGTHKAFHKVTNV